jgi:hypothetical protein
MSPQEPHCTVLDGFNEEGVTIGLVFNVSVVSLYVQPNTNVWQIFFARNFQFCTCDDNLTCY